MFEKKFIMERKRDLLSAKMRVEKELDKFTKTKGKSRKAIFPEIGSKEDESAQEVEMYESSLGLEKSLVERLNKINAALIKMDSGKYGKCKNCGEFIPKERLAAYPEADICLKCSKK